MDIVAHSEINGIHGAQIWMRSQVGRRTWFEPPGFRNATGKWVFLELVQLLRRWFLPLADRNPKLLDSAVQLPYRYVQNPACLNDVSLG
jgi:hypothetical protein